MNDLIRQSKDILAMIQRVRYEVEDIEEVFIKSMDEDSEQGIMLSDNEIDQMMIESIDVNKAVLEITKYLQNIKTRNKRNELRNNQ